MAEVCIVDASAMVDLLLGTRSGEAVGRRLAGAELHAPAHFDAEVLSALGRLQRAGDLTVRTVGSRVDQLAAAPLYRHTLESLVAPAWRRRGDLRLTDALYAVLADELDAPIVTTDARFASASRQAELVTG